MYSEEKIKFVESCLNELGDITEEQLKIMRFAIIKSIPRATLTDKLENELTGNDSNLLIVFYVQIMPDDFVMQLHRF